jgi:20S proteasome alpha/beta subunit
VHQRGQSSRENRVGLSPDVVTAASPANDFTDLISFRRDNLNNLAIIHLKLWKFPARPKVTIAIGLICKGKEKHHNRIVLACDSETTDGGMKNSNAKKLGVVGFVNGSFLVTQAGSAEIGDKVIEIMQKKASQLLLIENEEIIPNLARDAIREVRSHFVELNKDCPRIDWQRFFWVENPLDLLIAYYFENKPFLYHLDIDRAIPFRIKDSFRAIGAGKDLATFLLKEYDQADPGFLFGDLIAQSVIEKVIPNVSGCGYPAWVSLTFQSGIDLFQGASFIYPKKCIEAVTKILGVNEMDFAAEKRNQLFNVTKQIWEKNRSDEYIKGIRENIQQHVF